MLLFGTRWQSDLARALGTSDRMMRYWLAGTHAQPADLRPRLVALLRQRAGKMEDMIAQIGRSEGEKE